MKLNEFLRTNGLTMAAFAADVGTTAATISRIADHTVMPRRPLIQQIYERTGGLVTPNDLAGLYCTTPCPSFGSQSHQQPPSMMKGNAINDPRR